MGAAVAILNSFDTDRWNSEVYEAMALAARFSALVKNRAATYNLAYRLWKLDHTLDGFMKHVHELMENPNLGPEEPITAEKITEVAQTLRRLYKSVDRIYLPAKSVGLTNNSLTSPVLNSVHKHAEDILELAEWVELFLEPESLEAIFQRAEGEMANGEIFNLDEI